MLTQSCLDALFPVLSHYLLCCISLYNAVCGNVMPSNHQSTNHIHYGFTCDSTLHVIIVLPFCHLCSPLYQFEKKRHCSAYPNLHSSGRESSQDMEGAAVQSRLAGYLMSLVIGLLWPPRIPALLLLMCAGTERAMACTPSLPPSHPSLSSLLPSLTPSIFSLNPSFFHELT